MRLHRSSRKVRPAETHCTVCTNSTSAQHSLPSAANADGARLRARAVPGLSRRGPKAKTASTAAPAPLAHAVGLRPRARRVLAGKLVVQHNVQVARVLRVGLARQRACPASAAGQGPRRRGSQTCQRRRGSCFARPASRIKKLVLVMINIVLQRWISKVSSSGRGRGSACSRGTCHAGTQTHSFTLTQSAARHTHRFTIGTAPSSSGASAHAAAARRPPLLGQARARRGEWGPGGARAGDRLALADDQRVLQVQHSLLPVRRPAPARRPALGGRVSPMRARRAPPSSPAPQPAVCAEQPPHAVTDMPGLLSRRHRGPLTARTARRARAQGAAGRREGILLTLARKEKP